MKKKYKKLLITVIPLLVILSIGLTYSLFHSSATLATEDQQIAQFVFNAESLNHLELDITDILPGNTEEYLFGITNKSTKKSDVSIEYQFIIKTYHFIPFVIKLYKIFGETEVFVYECNETHTRNSDNELVCNSPIQSMEYSLGQLNNYKLKIEFPIQYNDPVYADLVDYINVEIKSWQKLKD